MSRFVGHEAEMHPDTQYHILVFDIIYCARTYGLYTGVKIKDLSTEEKRLYQQHKAKAAELAAKLEAAEKDMQLLQDGIAKVKAMAQSGAAIVHKSFGYGTLVDMDDKNIIVRFPGDDAPKKFQIANAVGSGFLAFDTPEFVEFVEKYASVLKRGNAIEVNIRYAENQMKPYIDYLD